MIRVIYGITDEDYTYLDISGHAESAEYGQDLICAAVSSIAFGLMNALDELQDAALIKEEEDHIEISISNSSPKVNDYMELALIQLKTIEESYGKYIKTERK